MVWLWLLLFAGLVITELLLGEMTALMLACGALAATTTAAIGLSWPWQAASFGVFSLLMVLFLRPVLRKLIESPRHAAGAEGFLGQNGEVIEAISAHGRGRIKIYGEIWNASCYEALDVGQFVTIAAIRDNCFEVVPRHALHTNDVRFTELESQTFEGEHT